MSDQLRDAAKAIARSMDEWLASSALPSLDDRLAVRAWHTALRVALDTKLEEASPNVDRALNSALATLAKSAENGVHPAQRDEWITVGRRLILAELRAWVPALDTKLEGEPDGDPGLPQRVVVGKNGAYWRDYGDGYSMCPVSEDNDPVEVVAAYVPAALLENARDKAGDCEDGLKRARRDLLVYGVHLDGQIVRRGADPEHHRLPGEPCRCGLDEAIARIGLALGEEPQTHREAVVHGSLSHE